MNILILLEIASLGGHALSALTTAKELARRGHHVYFAHGKGPLGESIAECFNNYQLEFYYYHCRRQTYFTYKSLKTFKQLYRIINEIKIDHIHAFDARSYILASVLSIRKRTPVTCTLCGGITPYYNIPTCKKVIVFSVEQKEKLTHVFGWNIDNVEVISSRLDMDQFNSADDNEVSSLLRSCGIEETNRNIMMITNFLGPKVEAIKCVLESIRTVLGQYSDVSLIFIGERGEFYQKANEIGEDINRKIGRKGVIFTGAILHAQRLLRASHIVLGVGRSAFEGMAHKKPTLIIGGKGYAGTVNKENIKSIWHFNFSGRNNENIVPAKILSLELSRLLDDQGYYESVRHFGVDFLKSHIDINAGIEKIEKVYQENSSYAANERKFPRMLNMVKVLAPILLDNHYNSLKSKIFPNKLRNENEV